jgi:hypothetical protein
MASVIAVAERWRRLPQPSYELWSQNCVVFVAQIAARLGLAAELPSDSRDQAERLSGLLDAQQPAAAWRPRCPGSSACGMNVLRLGERVRPPRRMRSRKGRGREVSRHHTSRHSRPECAFIRVRFAIANGAQRRAGFPRREKRSSVGLASAKNGLLTRNAKV